MIAVREVITMDGADAELCTVEGAEHDYRPHTYKHPCRKVTA